MELYSIKKYCLNPENLTYADNIKLLPDSKLFMEEIISTIKETKKSLLIEFYEIADDVIGKKISELLIDKAKSGVKIRVIYDSIGSMFTSRSFFDRLKENSIEVIEYNRVKLFSSFRKWFRRDHRKLLVSDFRKAIVGGFNLSRDYAPYEMGGRNWKDFGVAFASDAVIKLSEIFRETWISAGGNYFEIEPLNSSSENSFPVEVVSNNGVLNLYSIRRSYKYAIDNARDYIYITNAYFLPDGVIYRSLKKAVIRGVDVRILLPHKTDHPYVRIASFYMLKNLLKHGIKIYQWQKEILHSKTCVIDDFWVSVGSYNLDRISLHYNLELNINIYAEEIGKEMKNYFVQDLKDSKEITLDDVKRLPLSTKVFSYLMYSFRNIL